MNPNSTSEKAVHRWSLKPFASKRNRRARAIAGELNVVEPFQSLGDDVTKPLYIGLIGNRTSVDAKCQHGIPWVDLGSHENGSQCRPSVPGSRLNADHPENGVLIPCRNTF
jgi:hypothetical protein